MKTSQTCTVNVTVLAHISKSSILGFRCCYIPDYITVFSHLFQLRGFTCLKIAYVIHPSYQWLHRVILRHQRTLHLLINKTWLHKTIWQKSIYEYYFDIVYTWLASVPMLGTYLQLHSCYMPFWKKGKLLAQWYKLYTNSTHASCFSSHLSWHRFVYQIANHHFLISFIASVHQFLVFALTFHQSSRHFCRFSKSLWLWSHKPLRRHLNHH